MVNEILTLTGPIGYDERVTSIQDHVYHPYTTSYNYNDEIRIVIQNQDLYVLPHKSCIYIEGRVEIANTAADAAAAARVTPCFSNNAAGFLFNEIRYELNGATIDTCKNVGITSTIKGYLSYTPGETNRLETSTWKKESNKRSAQGHFNACIPLKNILGFAEDYRNIMMNAKHELFLLRSNSDLNVFTGANNLSSIIIDKIQWRVPHVSVADAEKLKLMQIIDKKQDVQLNFRTWELYEYPVLPTTDKHIWSVKASSQLNTPRFIVVAFQTNKHNSITADKSRFDHCQLSNLKLFLNSECYPYDNLNTNFEQNQYAVLYEMYCRFQEAFYHDRPEHNASPILTYSEFKNISPLVVIDCSHQNETLKKGIIDIRIEFQTRINIPAQTTAYCLIIHDNIITYNPYSNTVNKLV